MSGRFLPALLAASLLLAACGNTTVSTTDALSDTWLWNGSDWVQAQSTTTPPPRSASAFAYDDATKQVVLFGGVKYDSNDRMNDTWTWDGDSWTLQHPKTSPSPRSHAAMVYDPALHSLLLFGGTFAGIFCRYESDPEVVPCRPSTDVWAWNGSDWKQLSAKFLATWMGFVGSGIAYDYPSRRVVAVGCCGTDTGIETWTWDGSTWKQQPFQNVGCCFDFIFNDRVSGRLSAIANFQLSDGSLDKYLLRWSGVVWVRGAQIVLPRTPKSPYDSWPAGYAYDAQRGEVVALGGGCPDSPGMETWTFDGSTWNLMRPQHEPPARYQAYTTFDAARGTVVMFGGVDNSSC